MAAAETSIAVLVRFSRLVADARAPAEIMPLLTDAAVDHLGASAAAVLRVTGGADQATIVAARNLPDALRDWRVDVDALGSELAEEVIKATGGRFKEARVLPLVSRADLFGVLVLLAEEDLDLAGERLELATTIADLAAIAIARAEQYDELARSYAELRSSRDVMARTEKLRALGQMASGVAHDMKNILNPLGLQLGLLERRLDKDVAAARAVIGSMREVVKTGVDSLSRLTAFSRQVPETSNELVDLNATIATAIGLGRAQTGEHPGIRVVEELGDPPRVRARASELVTAVVNLILNATEVMPAGGTITVRTGASDGGGWLEVVDDGPGMSPEVEARVLEPFFTTKQHGTGLGLSMVYAFVQRQGGKLTLDTAPGAGARFRLWFPAAQPAT